MEPIIETYTMDWSEREQLRQERQLSRAKASLLERIPRQPMHTLPATLNDIEFHKTKLQQDEEKLRMREDELAEFQPTIIKMEKQKPGRYDRDPLRDNPSYHKYREYLAEKNRIESNLEVVKRNIEARKNRIVELEEIIEEWDPGKSEERDKQMREQYLHEQSERVRSAQIMNNEIEKRKNITESFKNGRYEETPLQRLSAHGLARMTKFKNIIHNFAGTNSPFGGRTKRKRTRRRY